MCRERSCRQLSCTSSPLRLGHVIIAPVLVVTEGSSNRLQYIAAPLQRGDCCRGAADWQPDWRGVTLELFVKGVRPSLHRSAESYRSQRPLSRVWRPASGRRVMRGPR